MVLVRKCPFFQRLFLGNIGQDNVFYDLQERKNACLGSKNKKFNKLKNWHFSKGANPWFGCKNASFLKYFFLRNIGQENVFYDILERKNAFLSSKNKRFKKSKNWHFSKVVIPWFWSENAHFSNVFFLGNISQENSLYDILKRINVFLGYKIKKFKTSKFDIFPKWLSHGFGPKMPIFPMFFF